MSDLRDRAVVVTGASGNLGAATARVLHAKGARLLLVDRSAEAVAKAIGDDVGRESRVIAVDATDEGKLGEAFDTAMREMAIASLDGLVSTIGGYVGGSPFTETSWETFEKMFLVNVRTTHAAARAALARFDRARGGSIVHVASMASLAGGAGESAYAAAKGALLRMTESLANEEKTQGVRVNAVLPGTIDTPQNRAWMNEDMAKRAIDPAAIADVIAFLLSPAARAVNGAAIRVTGSQ